MWRWALVVALTLGVASPAAAAEAPGAPGEVAHWATGAKQGVGTSARTSSKVWYTLSEGVLSEVYYPRVDVANSRALEPGVHDPVDHLGVRRKGA